MRDPDAWNGIVFDATLRGEAVPFAFRIGSKGYGSSAVMDGERIYSAVATVGAHAPDGSYAKMGWHHAPRAAQVRLEWSSIDETTVVRRISAPPEVSLVLEGYGPGAAPFTGTYEVGADGEELRGEHQLEGDFGAAPFCRQGSRVAWTTVRCMTKLPTTRPPTRWIWTTSALAHRDEPVRRRESVGRNALWSARFRAEGTLTGAPWGGHRYDVFIGPRQTVMQLDGTVRFEAAAGVVVRGYEVKCRGAVLRVALHAPGPCHNIGTGFGPDEFAH